MTNDIDAQPGAERYLIVGLGNPGRGYAFNRHNIGFMAVDRLAARHGIDLKRVQSKAIVGNGRVADRAVILAKPQTFMNLSGGAVGSLAGYYRVPLSNLLVVYDELDIPFGVLRLREKGGAGGHNGMRSIIAQMGNDFARLRLGIGRPPGRMDPAAYVLQDFGRDELPVVSDMLDTAVAAIETFVREGIALTMSRYNGPVDSPAAQG
ncbi:Peptidyl-tRNA hydrolase [Candidatus Promineifilum breve]|uniref:Peptidyl-tRNA hydrolase n=1 Tax=Candidatus Promineifilum breve TaxID=1806508 RepID=A0A170PIX6_9CHLR|nr:aminoacyl-tRNA hydrolase [Candidatus Promineifilum breve]CUS05103.2 Peptidyl-tRNA hydrolase [Candidatus Promineifilum breve]